MAQEQDTFAAEVAAAMRAQLPAVAERTVAAIVVEVPSYTEAFAGPMGRRIEYAVQLPLGGFLERARAPGGVDPSRPIGPALEEAFKLGRGEARSGRSMDALLGAYRVGARVAWRHMSETAVAAGMPAASLARFAELVFAYIDQLSAVSAAERADWAPPRTLTAVLLPESRVRGALAVLDARTLQAGEDLPGAEPGAERTVLLVPDADGYARTQLVRALSGREAVVGPARPWQQA